MVLDNPSASVLILICCPRLVPSMSNRSNIGRINDELVKFVAPRTLKLALQNLANERNITLSALLRLIASEYVKRNGTT